MINHVKYLSEEWRDEAETRLKENLTSEKMNNVTTSMSNIYLNCSDGKNRFLFISFTEGSLSDFQVGEGEPPKAEFRISGDYDIFVKISTAELGAQKGLMTGKLKLRGNMVKALKLASLADRVNKIFSTIDAEY